MGNALEIFGGRVQQVRLEKGLTQEGLADLAGFDRTYISLIERGKRNPSLTALCRLAKALGVMPADLLHGVPGMDAEGP